MKNSLLALALATGGLFTGLYAVSENRPVTIKAVVIPEPSKDFIGTAPEKPIPLTLKGNRDLPAFKNGVTEVKDIQPANVPYAPGIASILLLGGATWVYRAGTYTLKKNFPQYVQDIEDQAVAAKELAQIKKQNAALAIAHTNNAYRELAPELTPDQQADLEHLLKVQALRREQEILEEEIRVKKLRDALTGADKDSKGGKTPKKQLLARLKEHEGGWLDAILSGNKPAILIGSQGSGKTTLADTFLRIRKLVYGCEPIMVFDTHGKKNREKHWNDLQKMNPNMRLIGFTEEGQDWDSYLEEFYKLPQFFDSVVPDKKDASNLAKTASFIDETTFARAESETRGTVDKFWRAFMDVFTGSRKGLHSVTFGIHNLTKASVPDGCYSMIREGSNIITLRTGLDGLPTFSGTLGYRDENGTDIEVPITIPEWLNPKSIMAMFEDS